MYRYLHVDIYKKCRNSHPHNKTLECFECRAVDWSRVHFRFQPSRCQDNIHFHQQHFNWRIRDPNCPFQFKLLLICWFRVGGCCSSFGKMKKTELLQLIKSEKCWRTAAFSWRDTFAWRQFARFYARLQQRHVSFCHSCHSRNWQRKHYIYLVLYVVVAKCTDDLDTLIVWDDSLLTVSVFGPEDNYSLLSPGIMTDDPLTPAGITCITSTLCNHHYWHWSHIMKAFSYH